MKREFNTEKKEYTLSILVQDIPGVLSQVVGKHTFHRMLDHFLRFLVQFLPQCR